ncbi:hypothetical protein AB3S75_031594 [Citrus x aurantiifolia]
MMSPNNWIPSTKSLQRPLRLSDSTKSINVSISIDEQNCLIARALDDDVNEVVSNLTAADRQVIRKQITRMLRLTERDEKDVRDFQNIHQQAKQKGFGRLFRSPSLFEDIVKSILLCNSSWTKTLSMARALCKLQPELIKDDDNDSNSSKPKSGENFPTSRELTNLMNKDLMRELRINLGYRAHYILNFARKIERGELNIPFLEEAPWEQVYKLLMKNKGFGPFVCANVLACIGFYHKVPTDTETIRHLQEAHSMKSNRKTVGKDVKEVYDQYAPFQSLAYWFELLGGYESKFGKLSELDNSKYDFVTATRKPSPFLRKQ